MQEAHSHRMFEYIRWNINWGYVISSSSPRRGSTKRRKNAIIIRIFSKSQNLNSPFEKIVIFQSQNDERWATVFQHRDDSTILPSSPSGWNRVWLVSSLSCKCTSAKYTKCTTWHVAERWTGLGRDYFQRYFSLFFPVYIYIAETALLYGVKNVVPASTLFSLGKINLPATTGSMHENNREEWWKNRGLLFRDQHREFGSFSVVEWNR